MKIKNGFTLIELLVVVLIIGILAAIALPSYQRAVEKTRYAQYLTIVQSVWGAEYRVWLADASPSWTLVNPADLDITFDNGTERPNSGGSGMFFDLHGRTMLLENFGYQINFQIYGIKNIFIIKNPVGGCEGSAPWDADKCILCHAPDSKTTAACNGIGFTKQTNNPDWLTRK